MRRGSKHLPRPRATSPAGSRFDDDLDATVGLVLEGLVHAGRLNDWHGVGDQIQHAEWITHVLDKGLEDVGPAADVALTHPQLDLLVEHVHHRHRVHRAAVDPGHRHGDAPPTASIAACSTVIPSTPTFSN